MLFRPINDQYTNLEDVIKVTAVTGGYYVHFANGLRTKLKNQSEFDDIKSKFKKISDNSYINANRISRTYLFNGKYYVELDNGNKFEINQECYNSIKADPEIGGTTVIANPTGEATDNLTKIQIDNGIYAIPTGSGEMVSQVIVECDGESGKFSDSDFAKITDFTQNVVIKNSEEYYRLCHYANSSDNKYLCFMNINHVSDTSLSYKVIFVNMNSTALNYKTWSKDQVYPAFAQSTIIEAESATTLNGTSVTVPELSVAQVTNAYNQFVAGHNVLISDHNGYQNFKVIQAHAIGNLIAIYLIHNMDYILCYKIEGNSVTIESKAL